jgi:3-oxoacyl-[acyl-carrier-protein] synthase-1
MRQALARAGLEPSDVDYINLHGTGTQANDAMEDAGVSAVFGGGTACSSTKGFTGHTMGSCGVVEALIAKISIEHGFVPGNAGLRRVDPSFSMRVVASGENRPVRTVLSNAFGFGGINCSLLFGAA